MDVTSQLNLEREAGLGENTERQPVEPESLCDCIYRWPSPSEGATGALASPRGGQAAASFLPAAVARLACLPSIDTDSSSAPSAPPNTSSFFSPGKKKKREKQTDSQTHRHLKQQTKSNR